MKIYKKSNLEVIIWMYLKWTPRSFYYATENTGLTRPFRTQGTYGIELMIK